MSNNQRQLRITADTGQRAFTLVELLIVGAIIVILVALTLAAAKMSANSAKEAKTRATIQKIDTAIQQIFEGYEEKFRAIQDKVDKEYKTLPEEERQKIVAHFIRDLMRMEMPQSWAEVENSDNPGNLLGPIPITLNGHTYTYPPGDPQPEPSPLLEYYWQEYTRTHKAGKTPGRAALLFLIIQNLNPEALEAFHGSEVADTDDDGLLEFVDAWGNPIQFLRWAPAFPGSDMQPDVLALLCDPKYNPKTDDDDWWIDGTDQRLLDAMAEAKANYPDPIDERENVIGWFLYPLIYSAGPDGKYGIYPTDPNGKDVTIESPESPKVNPGEIFDPFASPYGMPYGSDHFDNIHNHQRYRSY